VKIIQHLRSIKTRVKDKLKQDPRNKQALLTGVTSVTVRFISIATSLISIPVTAQYLGKEQFGVWLLLSTFMNWMSIADLGLANSLVNSLSYSLAKGDGKVARQSISSAFFPMSILGLILLLFCGLLSFYSHLDEYLNIQVSTSLQSDTHWSIAVAICFLAVKIPLSISRCIFTAYQQGYIYQLWIGLTNLLSLISLFVLQYYHASLPFLLGGFFGCTVLGDILASIDIFYFRQSWLKPKLSMCSFNVFISLFKTGIQFWIIQICAICIFQTDLVIVSQLFGLTEVSIYGVLSKLFSIIEGVAASFLSPLWPAYGNAKAHGDYLWIRKTFWTSVIGSLIWSITSGSILLIFSPVLVNSFLGERTYFSMQIPMYMLITSVLLCLSQCIAMLINGLGEIRTMFLSAPLAAVTNIILSITLGKSMGIHGITFATAICILVFSIIIIGGDAMRKHSGIMFQSK
jgi:O-antigen/teichoic acid export membrane protein